MKRICIPVLLLAACATLASADTTTPATPASAPAPALVFSDIRRCELNFTDAQTRGISFAQGKVLPFPSLKAGATAEEKAAHKKYVDDNKIDGIVYTTEPDYGIGLTTGANTATLIVEDIAWANITPAELEGLLNTPAARKGGGAVSKVGKPITFIFRTIHGTIGIAQLLGDESGEHSWATLKSKILQAPATTSAPATAPK